AALLAPVAKEKKDVHLTDVFWLDETTTWQRIAGIGSLRDEIDINSNGQGATNFALAADPTNPNLVYVAGDAFNSTQTGVVYRLATSPKDQPPVMPVLPVLLVRQLGRDALNDPDDAPHADARDLVFGLSNDPATMVLLEASDGGLAKLLNPRVAKASDLLE